MIQRPRRHRFGALLALSATLIVAGAAGFFLVGGLPGPSDAGDPGDPDPAAASTATVRPAPSLQRSWYASAVYLMPLTANGPDVGAVMTATGQKTFQLAFILASKGACAPSWNGSRPVASDSRIATLVDSIRARGGDVSAAFGGGGGTKLGQVCPDADSTAAAYQKVIDRYRLRAIDFDLEDPEWRDAGAVAREIGAAQILERDNPGLYVSVTLPALQYRVSGRAIDVLEAARSIGFTPDNYSVMPFDFGGEGLMGEAAIDSLEAMHAQLMITYDWTSAESYRHLGASLMNGRTDQGEHYLPSDFETVLEYATGHGLGRFTYWSLNRDRQCNPPDNNGKTSGGCSSVGQEPWEYTRYTARFAAAMAGPTGSPGSQASTPPGASNPRSPAGDRSPAPTKKP